MSESEVFFLPKQRTIFYIAGACLLTASAPLILHLAFSGKYTGNSGNWIPFSLLWLILAIGIYLQAKLTTLTVSKAGLQIKGVILKSEVSWGDISQVDIKKNFVVLLLNTPAKPSNSITSWCYCKNLISAEVISLNDFFDLWEKGSLKNIFPEGIQINILEEDRKFPSFHKN